MNDITNDQELLEQALVWIMAQLDQAECPYCGARYDLTEAKDNSQRLRKHIQLKHPVTAVDALRQQQLIPVLYTGGAPPPSPDPADPNQTPHEAAGLMPIEELDRYDALFVPRRIRDRAKQEGAVLRWAAPDKVNRYRDQGAERVERFYDDTLPRQGSTEDTSARANELTLMKFPQALAQKRREQKMQRINNQLASRREEIERTQSEVAKAAYDAMLRQGHDRQTARNVAGAIERGHEAGFLRLREPKK